MKIFSATGQALKPKRSTAINCLLVNQFATPGLGSLMGGRILAGLIQLTLAVAGFAMVILWMYQYFGAMAQSINGDGEPVPVSSALGKAGFAIFIASWILSWFTSLSLVRQAPRNEP